MTGTRPSLNPYLKDFWRPPADPETGRRFKPRVRVLHGGRSSGKTWDTAAIAVFFASQYRVRILCTRMFQNRLQDSVYSEIKSQVERFSLTDQFEFTKNGIINTATGSEFLFYGIARNIDEIKGLSGIDILWIEEAHNLTKEMFDLLEPTVMRNEGAEIWVVFNPRSRRDFAYDYMVTKGQHRPDYLVRQINYTENPFLSSTMIKTIEAKRLEDEDDFNHIYRGEPRDDDDLVIIKRAWLLACVDAHKKLDIKQGKMRAGYDVADSGDDKNALILASGNVSLASEQWKAKEDELYQSSERVYKVARDNEAMIVYDGLGVGAGTGSNYKKIKKADTSGQAYKVGDCIAWKASGEVMNKKKSFDGKVTNGEMFENVKAQSWWHYRKLAMNTYNAINKGMEFKPHELLSLSSEMDNLDQLIDELSAPYRAQSNNLKMMVEKKSDMAKRGIPSPNLADAEIMAKTPFIRVPKVIVQGFD